MNEYNDEIIFNLIKIRKIRNSTLRIFPLLVSNYFTLLSPHPKLFPTPYSLFPNLWYNKI